MTSPIRSHHSDSAPAAIGPYSQAVSHGGQSYVIGPDDTLLHVASKLGVDVDPGDPKQWTTWVGFVEGTGGIGDEPILRADVGIPVTPIARSVDPGQDSLGEFAEFFGAAPGSSASSSSRPPCRTCAP